MKTAWVLAAVVCLFSAMLGAGPAIAEQAIVVGLPSSLTAIEGRESLKAAQMAVDEINAKGGVKVGNVNRLLSLEAIDLRDSSPGVPVGEALLGLEKIITEKKPAALVVGPFRSEALLAGMDIIAKYKVPLLGTIAMSPKSEDKIKSDPKKYKYIFRVCLNAKYLVGYLAESLGHMKEQFGFSKLYLMHQDVLWARATAEGTAKVAGAKYGWTTVGKEKYPTGASDFSAGLSKARASGAQVILTIFDMPQGGILIKQSVSMKIPALLAGYIGPMCGSEAWKTFEGRIAGLLNADYELGSGIATSKYPPSQKFYDAYKKKYGIAIQSGHGPAPAYDSVYILAEAIERAGSLDPDKIVDEIKKDGPQGSHWQDQIRRRQPGDLRGRPGKDSSWLRIPVEQRRQAGDRAA